MLTTGPFFDYYPRKVRYDANGQEMPFIPPRPENPYRIPQDIRPLELEDEDPIWEGYQGWGFRVRDHMARERNDHHLPELVNGVMNLAMMWTRYAERYAGELASGPLVRVPLDHHNVHPFIALSPTKWHPIPYTGCHSV